MNMTETVVKLLLALVAGGLIGAEREFHDKTAGFRTITFICVGATLFTILSLEIGSEANDPGRIAASIVTGIGFIGAGVILRREGHVTGVTTASTIWVDCCPGDGNWRRILLCCGNYHRDNNYRSLGIPIDRPLYSQNPLDTNLPYSFPSKRK